MNKIEAALFDADGTLITGGNFNSVSLELKSAISNLRSNGILFNLASGRALFEQEELYKILTNNAKPKHCEAILYEGAAVKLFSSDKKHILGGLTQEQITEVKKYLQQNNLIKELVPQANNELYETCTSYLTPGFITNGVTDKTLLEERFKVIKTAIETAFPFSQVTMSADAVDIIAKGVTKDKPTMKYSQLTGIPLNQIAVFGDSGNDMPMLELVGKAGGLVVYVGDNQEQIEVVKSYSRNFIPTIKGPMGTVEGIKYVLENNKVG